MAAAEERKDAPCGATLATAGTTLKSETLIPCDSSHPGAGAALVTGVAPAYLARLDELRLSLPLDERRPTAKRRFFRDTDGWVGAGLLAVLRQAGVATAHDYLMPWFRVLEYAEGGGMAAHTDGSNAHPDTRGKSTCTVLLYLSTCASGGATALLETQKDDSAALASVQPTRGSVLVFPHKCPHAGVRVGSEPKIALRGELIQVPPSASGVGAQPHTPAAAASVAAPAPAPAPSGSTASESGGGSACDGATQSGLGVSGGTDARRGSGTGAAAPTTLPRAAAPGVDR